VQKFTINLRNTVCCMLVAFSIIFSGFAFPEDSRVFVHAFLNKYYDKEGQKDALKRYELNVTNTGFCRYRKVFANGKEEFFSFNLSRFQSMDFYGDVNHGILYLRTKSDDVIVQTRNDRAGAVDSMATYMAIPLRNIDVEQLNELNSRLSKLNGNQLAANK
jgi:hypothetical protein